MKGKNRSITFFRTLPTCEESYQIQTVQSTTKKRRKRRGGKGGERGGEKGNNEVSWGA